MSLVRDITAHLYVKQFYIFYLNNSEVIVNYYNIPKIYDLIDMLKYLAITL
jgi:hypothetical protein